LHKFYKVQQLKEKSCMQIGKKEIKEVVYELVGEDVFPLIDVLMQKSNISEFQISSVIKMPVDAIRNQLYRLYNHNLVEFNRKKDKVKGWYIYYWTLNLQRVEYLVLDIKRKKIETIKGRIKREQENTFFTSDSRCIRVDFEQATELGFRCPETGELLYQEDNSQTIKELEAQISQLEKEVTEEEKKRAKLQLHVEEEAEEKPTTKITTKKTKVVKKSTTTKKKTTVTKKTAKKTKTVKKVTKKKSSKK